MLFDNSRSLNSLFYTCIIMERKDSCFEFESEMHRWMKIMALGATSEATVAARYHHIISSREEQMRRQESNEEEW